MSKRANTVNILILLFFFLILLFLALIGNSLWLLLVLIGAMAFVIKVIIEGIFAVKVKYPFITYYPLAVLLFFGYGALCVTFEYPLHAIILVIAIFLSTVSLVVVKPNINMLRTNINALSGLSHKKLILPIGFGVIGALAGATIFVMVTMVTVNISGLYSSISTFDFIPGLLGGIGVGLGAKFSDFKPTKALKFLGIIMGLVAVLLGYYFLYKWIVFETFKELGVTGVPTFNSFLSNPLDTLLAFFFCGLFGGYVGIDFFAKFLADEKLKPILTKAKAKVLLLVCIGIFLILIALGCFDDYIKLGHVLLYDLIFIIGIFLFSCGIHKLKLELLDILVIITSSVAIAILLFDCFLDYQPQNTFFYAMLSVEGLSTLLIIAIISGIAFFILDFVEIHFFMDSSFKYLVAAILSAFVFRPTVLLIISLFVPGFSANFFGAVVGVLVITSLVPRWDQFLSNIGIVTHEHDDLEFKKSDFNKFYETEKKRVYKTYSNEKYEFSIKYPNGWKLHPYPKTKPLNLLLAALSGVARLSPLDIVVVTIDGSDGAQINIIVGPIYEYSKTVEATQKYADEYIQRQGVEKIDSRKIRIDGIPSYQITYIRKFMIFKMAIKKTSIVRGGYEYVITCRVPYKYFLKYETIFDECTQSFKFKREAQKQNIKKDDKGVETRWDPAYR